MPPRWAASSPTSVPVSPRCGRARRHPPGSPPSRFCHPIPPGLLDPDASFLELSQVGNAGRRANHRGSPQDAGEALLLQAPCSCAFSSSSRNIKPPPRKERGGNAGRRASRRGSPPRRCRHPYSSEPSPPPLLAGAAGSTILLSHRKARRGRISGRRMIEEK
nr:uncharacterized protein LOC112938203 [Oryza sativa Japonica Group]